MNCQEVHEHLAGRLVDALPAAESARLDEHLSGCADCRAEREAVQARVGLLRQWPAADAPPDLARRTMAFLQNPPPQPWWMRAYQGLLRFAYHQPRPLTAMATLLVAVCLLVPVLSPNLYRARSSGAAVGCRGNLRVLSDALQSYAGDHQGHYPDRLDELSPTYLRAPLECPSAGQDTYREGYASSSDHLHYTLSCHGRQHAADGLPADQPALAR